MPINATGDELRIYTQGYGDDGDHWYDRNVYTDHFSGHIMYLYQVGDRIPVIWKPRVLEILHSLIKTSMMCHQTMFALFRRAISTQQMNVSNKFYEDIQEQEF